MIPLICVLLLAVSTGAEGPQSKPPVHESHLQAIDWLTHGTWTTEFSTPDGKPFVIETELRWAPTGTAIYFNSRFNHEAHYFGMYAYDPASRKIKFVYAAQDGEYTYGTAAGSEKGLAQDFFTSAAAGTTHYTCEIRRVSEDAYDFKVFSQGSRKPMVALHYVRK